MRKSDSAWLRGACVATFLACATLAAAAAPIDESMVVDLTHTFDENTIYWPTEKGFDHEKGPAGLTPQGYYYSANRFETAEHGGTHMDAPIHFAEGALTADAVPLSSLIGPAVVIDVSEAAGKDRDYRVRVADLEAWEKKHGRIPEGAIVVMRSGWSERWPDRERVLGTAKTGDVEHLHFPAFSKEAAEFLVEQRKVGAIGVDTPSIDHGPSRDFIVHRIVGAANKPALENVANLERLPETGATIIALPMKIGDGSGAPTRVIAILP